MYKSYYEKKRTAKKFKIIFMLITVIAITFVFTLTKTVGKPKGQIGESKKEKVNTVVKEEKSVSKMPSYDNLTFDESTNFNLTTYYSCGHEETSITKIPPEFIGKTIEEIKNNYPEYEIYDYNKYEISANTTSNSICKNHYTIILKDKKLIAYNNITPSKTEKEIKINLSEYTKEDIEILKSGIEVSSYDEMLEILESFSS